MAINVNVMALNMAKTTSLRSAPPLAPSAGLGTPQPLKRPLLGPGSECGPLGPGTVSLCPRLPSYIPESIVQRQMAGFASSSRLQVSNFPLVVLAIKKNPSHVFGFSYLVPCREPIARRDRIIYNTSDASDKAHRCFPVSKNSFRFASNNRVYARISISRC
jgi:hypothetical protein